MIEIDPKFDCYGKYARISYLADLVEAHVLSSTFSTNFAYISDALKDSGCAEDIILTDSEPNGDADDDNYEPPILEWVVSEFKTRADVMKGRYPFALTNSHIELKDDFASTALRYCELLGLTLAHSHRDILLDNVKGLLPSTDFEWFVQDFFSTNHPERFVAIGGARSKFDVDVIGKLRKAGFDASTSGVTRSKYANDDGIDGVASWWEIDGRPGLPTLVVQATVGASDSWRDKANEATGNRWIQYLGTGTKPQAVLAVPHVIESAMLKRLVAESSNPALLDRARLVHAVGKPSTFSYAEVFDGLQISLFK